MIETSFDPTTATSPPKLSVENDQHPQISSSDVQPSLEESFFARVGKPVQVIETQPDIQKSVLTNPEAETLQRHLENALANPSNYTPDEIEGFIAATLGEKSLVEIQADNPSLAATLEKLSTERDVRLKNQIFELSQDLSSESPIEASPQNLEEVFIQPNEIQNIEKDGENELIIRTTNATGQEKNFKLSNALALAAFVAVDLALFRGNNTLFLLHELTSPMIEDKMKTVFGKMGITITEDMYPKKDLYNDLLRYIKTPNLAKFVESLPNNGNEMYKFLKGLGKEQYLRLVKGERFGGDFFDQHQFTREQIENVMSKLTSWQIRELGLEPQSQS